MSATESTTHGQGCSKLPRGELNEEASASLRYRAAADSNPPSTRPLKIRHLKTAYGDFVDLEEQVVGDLFDERGSDGNIRNSILEVHRYPPRSDELENLQRFSSLPPNSSARPRKRPLELHSQPFPSQSSRNTYREIPSIEKWDAETDRPVGTASKRQRTHESGLNRTFNAYQPLRTHEELGDGVHHSSQNSGTQESIHQVLDSQKSPGKKRTSWLPHLSMALLMHHSDRTPYGTPTSLPQIAESIPRNEIDLSAIPDSPLSRKTTLGDGALGERMQLGRESTKSESPELRSSVHEVPSSEPIATPGEQPASSVNLPEPSTTPFFVDAASQPLSIQGIVNENTRKQGLGLGQTGEKTADINRVPERRPSTGNETRAQNVRSGSKILRKPAPAFDPIESEAECEHDNEPMQSEKCPKSCEDFTASFTSSRVSDGAGTNRRDGRFLVPLVPQSRMDEARISKPHGDNRRDTGREAPKSNTFSDEVVDAFHTTSQASTALSRGLENSTDGIGKSTTPKINSCVSSQGPEPDETARLSRNASGVDGNPADSHFSQEADRLTENAEKQQEKRGSEVQKTTAKESAGEKEATSCEANEQRLPDQEGAQEQIAGTENSVQARKAKVKEVEPVGAKRIQETRVNAERLAEKKAVSEKLARGRQIKETALAEKANRAMLAADGAKQIEAEKKARLEELAAKKEAGEAKANEQARKAQAKFREEKARKERQAKSKDSKQRDLRDSSEVRHRCSITPSASHNIQGRKRSMTPIVPGHSVTNPSYQNSLGSSPLGNHSSGSMNAPLRSALKQNPSGLRRSVSSVSFDVPPLAKLNEYIPSTSKPKSLKEINEDLVIKQPSQTRSPKTPPETAFNASSTTPVIHPVPKKASDNKITKISAKNGKVQTKLNVTREKKKLKGRAVGRPITPKPSPKQEIILSSGEDSSPSDEPVWQTGNAKAGPSSRRPYFPVLSAEGKKMAEVKPSGTPIDPVIRNIKSERAGTATPAALPCSTSRADTATLHKSTSRSPAQALSETFTLSSDSASTSASKSDSEIESDSEDGLETSTPKTPTGANSGKLAPVATKNFSNAIDGGAKRPQGYSQTKTASQSSQASSSRPSSTASMQRNGKHIDQAADKQLLLESQKSVTKSRIKPASSTINGPVDNKIINQGLDHAGRLPNGIRPAYYKYPGLSELKKPPRPVTPEAKPKSDALPKSESESSSSDSDESSSDSDEDEDINGVSCQTSSKKSGRIRGLRGVLKRRSGRTWCGCKVLIP